ncbi:stage II sporulation protein D [Mycoplasmatota bacterium zrk1]
MITNYKIEKNKGSEVLHLYYEGFTTEFSSDFFKNSNESFKSLKKQVIDYIKSNKIDFKGTMAKVMIGGALTLTVLLGNNIAVEASNDSSQDITYFIQEGDNLWKIARKYNTSVNDLKAINNLQSDNIYPGEELTIRLPLNTREYIVQEGDNLWIIAKQHNISIDELKTSNNLTSDVIHPGDSLYIYPSSTSTPTSVYQIEYGDSLWTVARKFNMSVSELKELNNLTTDAIYVGNSLIVNQINPVEETQNEYIVKSGDSLWSISNKFNISVADLIRVNNLDSDVIYINQRLTINSTVNIESDITLQLRLENGQVINISLEEYVVGVVSSEMYPHFHEEALKAQALAARTYALKAYEEGVILSTTDYHQVYQNEDALRKLWGAKYDEYYGKMEKAVLSTKGEVIKYNGELIDALYFSTSNGKTENPFYIWGGELDYLQSVNSPWDVESTEYLNTKTMSLDEFSKSLGVRSSNVYIEVLSWTSGDRIENIKIDGITFDGNTVKSKLGLRSTDFSINIEGDMVHIEQRGWGHGVGMSQYGAHYMSQEGYTYDQIIKHYYQNVNIEAS